MIVRNGMRREEGRFWRERERARGVAWPRSGREVEVEVDSSGKGTGVEAKVVG